MSSEIMIMYCHGTLNLNDHRNELHGRHGTLNLCDHRNNLHGRTWIFIILLVIEV